MASPLIADSSIGGAFGHLAFCRGLCPPVQDSGSCGRILANTVPACLFWKRQGCPPGTKPAQLLIYYFLSLQLTTVARDSVRVLLPCLRSLTAWSTTRCFGRRPVLVATARLPVLQKKTQAQHKTMSSKVSSRRGVLALPHLQSRKQHVPRAPLRSSPRRSSRRRNLARSSARSSWSGRRRTPRTEQGALCDPVAPIRGLWPWLFPES